MVYIIEPEPLQRDRLQVLLGAVGYDVETFATAENFLAARWREKPGCILTEVDLPGLTGLELQARLAEEPAGLPIIFIASRGGVATAVRALRAGAADFIEKPLIERLLLKRIEEVVTGGSASSSSTER